MKCNEIVAVTHWSNETSKLRGVHDTKIRTTMAVGILTDVRGYQFDADLAILKKISSLAHGLNEPLYIVVDNKRCLVWQSNYCGLMTSISDPRDEKSFRGEMWNV